MGKGVPLVDNEVPELTLLKGIHVEKVNRLVGVYFENDAVAIWFWWLRSTAESLSDEAECPSNPDIHFIRYQIGAGRENDLRTVLSCTRYFVLDRFIPVWVTSYLFDGINTLII